ncbi:MAG TPA: nitrilase-related carbon-nitrogen hydrolase, partial [Symbiobacteriaceae bacterium]|nr:nitrilase-related carbon-nitrogen hydrolase [Symbiobacteriaceae bacterium]
GHQTAWRARAMENGLYLVCANRWGEERGVQFCGNTAVLDPFGASLNQLPTGDGLVLAKVDTDLTRRARGEALARRHPERYQELLLSSYLWHWTTKKLPQGRLVTIAACQGEDRDDVAGQVEQAAARARENGWPGLELAVLPDLRQHPDAHGLAQAFGCCVVWGEGDGARLVMPDGREAMARSGDLVTLDLPWGRLGLLTGADLRLPEPARILAKRGADVLAAPVRWEEGYSRLLWFDRCEGNGTVVAVANAVGGSCIHQPVRPHTAYAASPGEAALALVDTGAEELRSKELLRMLQPRWYDALVQAN